MEPGTGKAALRPGRGLLLALPGGWQELTVCVLGPRVIHQEAGGGEEELI